MSPTTINSVELQRLRQYQFEPSGDNHHNAALCPHCGEPLRKALVEIERLNAMVAELRHQAKCYWYGLADGEWALSHCEECRTLWEAVKATGTTVKQREGGGT